MDKDDDDGYITPGDIVVKTPLQIIFRDGDSLLGRDMT